MSNTLIAIKNLVTNQDRKIKAHYSNVNRANSMGDALELYIKDLYADSYNKNEGESMKSYNQVFSYLGNSNNPPDAMLKSGDAIEIKKIQSPKAKLALNSSYPKSKLYSDSSLITDACRKCEDWEEKDLAYFIGYVKDNELKYIWIVYGDCYAADRNMYKRIKQTISKGIDTIPNVEFAETNELGRVNKVDPLGITYLRIRGMWGIDNPNSVFSYLGQYNVTDSFQMFCLMTRTKYNSFPSEDRHFIESHKEIEDTNCEIQNPNNPAELLDAVLLKYSSK